jgi:hypothetical protein
VELSGDVALEAPDDLVLGDAFGGAALDGGDGLGVPVHADDD